MVQRLVTNLFQSDHAKGQPVPRPVLGHCGEYAAPFADFLSEIQKRPGRLAELPDGHGAFAGQAKYERTTTAMSAPLMSFLFDRLEMVNPEHIALKYYWDYHSGSAKTLKSIQINPGARLEKV